MAAGQAEGISRSIINIGSGREVSIGELVETIERVLGESVHRLCASGEKAGVTRLVADVDLARRTLGYTPRVSLEEGLQRTIARDGRFSPR